MPLHNVGRSVAQAGRMVNISRDAVALVGCQPPFIEIPIAAAQ